MKSKTFHPLLKNNHGFGALAVILSRISMVNMPRMMVSRAFSSGAHLVSISGKVWMPTRTPAQTITRMMARENSFD